MSAELHGVAADFRPWSREDLEVLRAVYPKRGVYEVAQLLGRTKAAVFHQANRQGLKVRRRWTAKDDARLRWLWDSDATLQEIARALERTPLTTYWRAQKLGLPLGVPSGYEYLNDAVKRCGYGSTDQLRRILKWAGVAMRPVRTRRYRQGSFTCHYVDPFDVDDAIERWHRTETLESAARRHGVCAQTMRRWLLAIGVEDPRRGRKDHWRVLSEDADRAMEMRARPRPKKQRARGARGRFARTSEGGPR